MEAIRTEIDCVYIIEPKIFEDSRGYFFESYNDLEFLNKVKFVDFVQEERY